jgi:hypothetical protein
MFSFWFIVIVVSALVGSAWGLPAAAISAVVLTLALGFVAATTDWFV